MISKVALLFWCPFALAKLSVITTTSDLAALVSEIGKDRVTVESICRGTQDPHYLEAKPSFVIKMNRADLVVAIGLGLEVGWLPSIVKGARNSKVMEGNLGYLEVGSLVGVLEKNPNATRAEGDVHPEGNPHVTLDPIRLGNIAIHIAERMGALDTSNANHFADRAKVFQKRMVAKTVQWKARVDKTGIKKAVTHHKTLTYFLDRFQIQNPTILEPKPGIPPTSKHTLEVIRTMKAQKIPIILIENFFDSSVAQRIVQELPTVRVVSVPVAVEGESDIHSSDELFEKLVSTLEGKS